MKKRAGKKKGTARASRKNKEPESVQPNHFEHADDYTVTEQEKRDLQQAAEITDWKEEEELKNAAPNNVDEDGEPLNEKTGYKDLGAGDLDIPDEFEDDPDEELGKSSREEDPDTLHIIQPDEH